jgi:hypothetical protein
MITISKFEKLVAYAQSVSDNIILKRTDCGFEGFSGLEIYLGDRLIGHWRNDSGLTMKSIKIDINRCGEIEKWEA